VSGSSAALILSDWILRLGTELDRLKGILSGKRRVLLLLGVLEGKERVRVTRVKELSTMLEDLRCVRVHPRVHGLETRFYLRADPVEFAHSGENGSLRQCSPVINTTFLIASLPTSA
jgi:hypothetical protein